MATTYNDKLAKVSITMKYPDKSRFSFSNFLTTAADEKLAEAVIAMNDLQQLLYSEIIRTDTSVISSEIEA